MVFVLENASKGKILIIDDEEMFLFAQSRLLSRLGYQVLQASSGERGIEIYGQEPGSVDLVILDLVMPEMDGAETFAAIRRLDPGARVLLCSGYSKKGVVSSLLEAGAAGFLQKPFESHELIDWITSLIDPPGA